ncbi:MAG: peptidoglycan-binding domain-containing protein [bacterium]|nr:peptidoglycan-binding domain-containing protein [bacterium]
MHKYLVALSLVVPLGVSASFERDLYYGLRNDPQVQELQEFLTEQGVYTGPITGNFFSLTLQAVKNFQTQELISPVSGYFGPISRGKANGILATKGVNIGSVTTEEGTITTVPSSSPKTTDDVVASLMAQIALLQQQLTAFKDQQTKLDAQQQTLSQQATILGTIQQEQVKQTAALEQVKVNTTPAPVPVPQPAPVLPPTLPVEKSVGIVNVQGCAIHSDGKTIEACFIRAYYTERTGEGTQVKDTRKSATITISAPTGTFAASSTTDGNPLTTDTIMVSIYEGTFPVASFMYYPAVDQIQNEISKGCLQGGYCGQIITYRIHLPLTVSANGATSDLSFTSSHHYPYPVSQ